MRSSSEWNATTASRPPVLQHAFGRFETALEFAQFVVHIDAQRLEGARGGMDRMAGGRRAKRLGHDLGELRRALDRAGRDDGAGNAARHPLFAEVGR